MLRFLKLVLLVSAALALTACAGFRGGNLGQVDDWKSAKIQPKVSVDYTFTASASVNGNQTPVQGPALDTWKAELEKSFQESGFFSSQTLGGTSGAAKVAVTFSNVGNGPMALAFLSGFTFGVIPAWATDTFTGRMVFSDANGKVLGTVEKSVSVTMVIHLTMLPLTPFKFPFSEASSARMDLYRSILLEARQKGYI